MNIINAVGQYKTDYTTPLGAHSLLIELPGTGRGPKVPIYLIPTWAAKDSCKKGAFKEDTHLLISGRLYLGKDYKMYVIPTQEVYAASPGLNLNHVSLAGGVGFIAEAHNPDVFNFGMMCQAPPQKVLEISKEDRGPGFRIEAWGEDGKRMRHFLYQGRSLALGGALKYEQWEKNGEINSRYKIRVNSNQYSFFGKSKPTSEQKDPPIASFNKPEIFDSPHQQSIAKPTTISPDIKDPVDDGVPF